MRALSFLLVIGLVPCVACAAGLPSTAQASAAADNPSPKRSVFRLLPKSFQDNPDLEMTAITEMTEDGRDAPKPTAARPIYYATQSAGFRTAGEGSPGSTVIPAEELQDMMQAALAKRNFLPVKQPRQRPELLLVYQWGFHGKINNRADSSIEVHDMLDWAKFVGGQKFADDLNYELENSPETRLRWLKTDDEERKNLLERTSLVGGTKFAREFKQVLEATDRFREQFGKKSVWSEKLRPEVGLNERRRVEPQPGATEDDTEPRAPLGLENGLPPEFGSPLHSFIEHNPKVGFLFAQSAYDVYFVVVTAYDYDSLATDQKKLLWRTKMTVHTGGVSMTESVPTLISTAAPLIGKEMTEAATFSEPLRRKAKVEIGPLKEVPPASTTPPMSEKK